MNRMQRIRRWSTLLLAPVCLFAQPTTAELAGVASDATGAVISHVALTLTHPATGAQRTAQTDAQGAYRFLRLAPGSYELTTAVSGFRPERKTGIVLTVGQQAVLNLRLEVATVNTEAVVSAGAVLIDLQNTALSDVMDPKAIRELPLNGRDFAQLALLEPGVTPSRRTSDSGGPGTKLVINGNRPSQVSFVLDGSDINDANNNTPGSAAGVLLGVDTLEEFRVNTNAYSAAYGRSAGGVITAVTKSGTNRLHGSVFEFVRNSAFDAKNFFDAPSSPIPPFRRNQFGVEVDGPIVKNRTFFLASYEGLRQRLGVTSRTVVPDANARLGIFPNGTRVTVNPAVPAYLALVPLPNDRDFGDGTGEYVAAASQATDENFFVGRIDHRFSDRTSIFGRFTWDRANVAIPDGLRFVQAETKSENRYFTVEGTRILTERLVNTTRFSLNQSNSDGVNNFLRTPDPSLSFFPGRPFGQISVTGFFSLGPSRFGPSFSEQRLFQFSNDLSWVKGRHSLKFGFDHRFYQLPTSRPQSPYGFYQFNGLVDFLQARPASVELTLPDSQINRDWRQSMTAFFVQDDIRVNRRLSLNLGLRYERVSVPEEVNGLSSNFRDVLNDKAPTVGPMFTNPSNRNFAPRVGFAWDPTGSGKTSVRGGFGVFFDPVWTDFYANAGNRLAPFYTLGSIRNPTFPRAETLVGNPAFVLGRQDVLVYHPSNPYTMQYNFTVQRQLASTTALTVSYAGQRGVHLARFVDGNQAIPQILSDGRKFFPENSVTRNPNLTGVRYKVTDGQSVYNALQTSLQHRLRGGMLIRLNYNFARTIDDGSVTVTQGGDNDLPQDPDSRKAERGLSNYDVRHYFSAFWNWDLPKAPGLPKWLGAGWQWNTISTFSAGNPFSVVVGYDRARARFQAGTSPQRPDLVAGRSTNPILGGPDRYFDPSAFALPAAGFFGNLGRNTLIGPGLAMVDMSVNKRFQLTERVGVQFRTEMFNSLNRPNFSIPTARTVFTSTGPVGSAGRITTTQTSARQLQFGLKLTF
ncbi:MAG TPA: TonB-dependent receptor [Bryobacteraceae bacterium]|nr:TonB-dependent receptor [Bryobacteraceae bacterium]